VGGGAAAGDDAGANWADVMANVLELQEEDIFRTIMVFL